jgi:ankyrin repeat protein
MVNSVGEKLIDASQEGNTGQVELLINQGADIEHRNRFDGRTPLSLASRHNWLETARVLLNRGANIEHRDNQGRTPLLLASRQSHLEMTQLLLDRGADIDHSC